jgi:hypothetical protein
MRCELLLAAKQAYEAKICVLPPRNDGTKAPIAEDGAWRKWQEQLSDQEDHNRWYDKFCHTGIGWVCGKISGNLEVLDFDNKETYQAYKALAVEYGLADIVEKIESGYLEYTPHGVHWPYRCEVISGNDKLARRPEKVPHPKTGELIDGAKTLIETRGNGGYIIVAPTYGSVNPDGVYELKRGSIATIATITPDERAMLLDLARSFDEMPPEKEAKDRPRGNGIYDEDRPGDIFNRKKTWHEILTPAGWTAVRQVRDTIQWRRPGKERGISATTNHLGSDVFYVFSSNAYPFEQLKSYTKLWAWAIIRHGGDIDAAITEIAEEYKDELEDCFSGINFDGICEERSDSPKEPPKPKYDVDILKPPGMVGELAAWINETSHVKQPLLAVASSIAANAMAMGRKVQSNTGLRTTIYALGIGPAGCGKDRGPAAIRKIYKEIGKFERVSFDDFASDAALEETIVRMPCALLLWDEIGGVLNAMKGNNANSQLKGIANVFKKLTGKSEDIYIAKERAATARAKKEGDDVPKNSANQPCICLYGMTTKSHLYSGLSSELVGDGFLSRIIVFEASSKIPYMEYPSLEKKNRPPKRITDYFTAWESFRTHGDDLINAEILRKHGDDMTNTTIANEVMNEINPFPYIIPCTPSAEEMFRSYESNITDKRNELSEAGDDFSCVFARCGSLARIVGLIVSCSKITPPPSGPLKIEVGEDEAKYAITLVDSQVDAFHKTLKDSVFDSTHEMNQKIIEKAIKKAGERGISLTRLTSSTRRVKRHDRSEILKDLIDGGKVMAFELPSSTRPAKMLKWICD